MEITFADDFVERTIDNPIPIEEVLKRNFIQFVNNKKGYTYIISKDESDE